MTFSTYRQDCRLRIQQRPEYATADAVLQQHILEANSPFEWAPQANPRKAVLLIHGLYDSPSSMHSLGEFFSQQQYLVRSLLLPGHGTRPEDLLQIQLEDWLSACQLALAQLPDSIDQLVLCGFSTGGLLHHYLSLKQDIPILKAIVSIAPALTLRAPSWLLSNRFLSDILKKLLPYHHQIARYDYARYTKHAFNAGCQVQRLINMSRALPDKIYHALPVFYVLTTEDEVIDSQAAQHFFQHHCSHAQSRCLIYGPSTQKNGSRFIHRPSHYPRQHIDSFSHLGLHIKADHPHYGEHGDYTRESYRLLKPGQQAIFGNMHGRSNIRLTYNPDFEHLAGCLQEFLDEVV